LRRWLIEVLVLAGVCLLTGGLALLTARPPAAPVVMPAVGLALAGLLVYGYRLWPAVWLAFFALLFASFFVYFPDQSLTLAVGVSALTACGFALQAIVGAWLIRQIIGYPTALIRVRDVVIFLAIAGPLHSVIASSVGVVVLAATGVKVDASSEWAAWWFTDTLGGVLFTPLALTFIGWPREVWQPRRMTVALPLLAASAVTGVGFLAARAWDEEAPHRQLRAESSQSAVVLTDEFDRLLAGMETVRQAYEGGANVRTKVGRAIVRDDLRLLRRTCPMVQWAAIVEVVEGEHRDRYEQETRRVGPRLEQFRIAELGPDRQLIPAGSRERYLVIAHIDPQGQYDALGFDLLSDPKRRTAFERALEIGRPSATGPVWVPQDPGSGDSFLTLVPFYESGLPADPAGRRTGVRGAIGVIINTRELTESLAAGRDPGLRFELSYMGTVEEAPRTDGARVELAGQAWDLRVTAEPEFLVRHQTRYAALTGAVGILLTALLTALLLTATGRTAEVAEQVAVRTRELRNEVATRRAIEARLADAQRIARIGSFEWTPGTEEAWWSSEMYRLHGYEPGEVRPTFTSLLARVHPDDRSALRDGMEAALERNEPYAFEYRVELPDGDERVLAVEAVVTRDETGRPILFRGTNQDITERIRAEADRRKFEENLQQTQKLESLGILAGGVAHDFNNLLTGILGNASLACEVVPPGSPIHNYLRPIEKSAEQAAHLCQQMLTYTGKGATPFGPVDLNQLVDESTDLLRLSVPRKATLHIDRAAGLPRLMGDAGQIRQVILNLVQNAAEALGPEGGKVTLRTGADAEQVWFAVTDTGCGMDEGTRARVFEPFFTTKFTGRGLGLSAVHGIVTRHGGTIGVESQPGRGTTFRVTLPAAVAVGPPAPAVAVNGKPEPPLPAGGTALVVDDEPAVRGLASIALRSLGFMVEEASTGREALDLFVADPGRFDLVLLDMVMPDLDGRETLAEMRKIRVDVPVVLISGYTEHDMADLPFGPTLHFLQKPFRPSDLTNCVRQAVAAAVVE
jgi:PAS domain S-box-containing protein